MLAGTFHHIGCAVRDLDGSIANYREMFPTSRWSRPIDVVSQAVRVCFGELAPGTYLELVAGTGATSPIERYTKAGFYHLCFLVDDLAAAVGALDRTRFRALPAFASEAFAGHRCQFVVTPETHLIELAEMTPDAFATFVAGQIA